MTSPLVYIAMPFRAGRYSERENIARANEVGRWYAAKGYAVVVPHSMSPLLDPHNRLGDDYWLRLTMEVMERCDIVVCGPGWEESAGALAERERAEALGLEVWEMEEVPV